MGITRWLNWGAHIRVSCCLLDTSHCFFRTNPNFIAFGAVHNTGLFLYVMDKGLCGHSSDKSVILDGSAEHCWEHATSIRDTGKEAEVKSSHTAQFIYLHLFNWQHFYLKHLNSSGEAQLQSTELSNCRIKVVFQKPCSGSLAVLAFQLPVIYLLSLAGYKNTFRSQNTLSSFY